MFASELLDMSLILIRSQDRPARSLLPTSTALLQLVSGFHYYNNIWLGVPVVKLLILEFFQSTVPF